MFKTQEERHQYLELNAAHGGLIWPARAATVLGISKGIRASIITREGLKSQLPVQHIVAASVLNDLRRPSTAISQEGWYEPETGRSARRKSPRISGG